MYNGRTEIINGKVYFRGMTLTDDDDDDDNILLCYDVAHDSWTALPPLPVKWFGLGQVDGKLVAVGGLKKDDRATNNIYTLNIVQKWKPTLANVNGSLSLCSCESAGHNDCGWWSNKRRTGKGEGTKCCRNFQF